MANSQQLIFIGIIHFELKETKDTKEIKILKKQCLDQVEDNDIKQYLFNEQEYDSYRKKAQRPFLKRLDKNSEYLLALQAQQQVNQVSHMLRGIEDHISEHLGVQLPEDEWKQRAIKILLTWNLSEKNELQTYAQGGDQVEKHFLELGFLFFAAAVIGYALILVMKHMI
ncbi:unnamed protein product [Paramecium sonneborni]|uniref:Uncharacterized protein n=1 Tax=Paramecium sonneborni TaxID=65129 RepID=A0A8S1PVW6_9CILI|nr:unnamed protein product [Paramecium sonneborni]